MNHWQTIIAIDSDRWAAETYRANFPGVRVECGMVADFVSALPAADIIIGGPPCQPFSDAGENEGEQDDRDGMPDFIAAVAKVRPRMFLMENVRGLLKERHLPYFGRVLASLEQLGYRVDYRVLDAVCFGVPQFRERVWVWGIRNDVQARHCWPKPTHAWPPPVDGLFGAPDLLAGITVGQALGLVGYGIRRAGGPNSQQEKYGHTYTPEEPAPTVTGEHGTAKGLQVVPLFLQSHADPPVGIDRPSPTLRSGGAGHDDCCLRVIGGGANPSFPGDVRTERDITNEPCSTIPAQSAGSNSLPRIEYDHGVAVLDAPSPTLKAGGNIDATGKQGGGCPPVIEYRWSDAMLTKHPPASPAPTIQAKYYKGGAEGLLSVDGRTWESSRHPIPGTDEPMPTVRARSPRDGGRCTEQVIRVGPMVRRLTPLECLRLQSGHDDFRWPDKITKTAMYRITGNGWASRMGAVFADAFRRADPQSRTVIDLFCGGGLGATGWHGRYWEYVPPPVEAETDLT